MSLQSFRIQNRRSIVLAEATSVPSVMVIAGSNGVGKSTLLYAIKDGCGVIDPLATNHTQILYQGPHRVIRSTSVQRQWLGGRFRGLVDLLMGGDVSGFDGLNVNATRTPENVDEAGSAIKYILGRIENKRQTLLAKTIDSLRKAKKPLDNLLLLDVYEPLKQLTRYLLPHLAFDSVDFADESNIKILFARKDSSQTILVDINDLSSGEKSIIVLFLPLLENQIQDLLASLENFENGNKPEQPSVKHRVVLIDEPEQHLHPDLQAKILTYMRNVTRSTPSQFIITTHSPTILDQAYDTELFVLNSPSEKGGENQLRQIATNAERLEALKQLAGSTYFLTTGRVVVCIEGEKDADPEKPTDARLLEILYPRATAVTLVPTTGKGNVITTVERLREHVPEGTFRIKVKGLVDSDQSEKLPPGIEVLPVCMIENLLLHPESIFEFLQSKDNNTFPLANDIEAELKSIAQEMRGKEIELRVRKRLKGKTVRLGGASLEQVKENHTRDIKELQALLPEDQALEKIINSITEMIDSIIGEGRELEQFRGKNILDTFYQRHVAPLNIGYNQFCIEIAKIIAAKDIIVGRLDPVFDRLMS